jgi:hypothetical protein
MNSPTLARLDRTNWHRDEEPLFGFALAAEVAANLTSNQAKGDDKHYDWVLLLLNVLHQF